MLALAGTCHGNIEPAELYSFNIIASLHLITIPGQARLSALSSSEDGRGSGLVVNTLR